MAKFIYTSNKTFERISDNLKKVIDRMCDSDQAARINYSDALASTLGFKNLSLCLAAIKSHKNKDYDTRWDEDLTNDNLSRRRKWQVNGLAAYFKKQNIDFSAEKIVEEWRPSSKHPFDKTFTFEDRNNALQSDLISHVETIFHRIKCQGYEPAPEDMGAIRKALLAVKPYIRSQQEILKKNDLELTRFNFFVLTAGEVAANLANRNDPEQCGQGAKVFEWLIEVGLIFAAADFIRCFLRDDSTPEMLERVFSLIRRTNKILESGDEYYVSYSEEQKYYADCGRILLKSKKKEDKLKAIAMLKAGFDKKSPKAAYVLGLIYSKSNMFSSQYPELECDFIQCDDAYSFYFLYWATEWENAPPSIYL
jgi:hypothetical protein